MKVLLRCPMEPTHSNVSFWKYFTPSDLLIIYMTYIRSKMEYSSYVAYRREQRGSSMAVAHLTLLTNSIASTVDCVLSNCGILFPRIMTAHPFVGNFILQLYYQYVERPFRGSFFCHLRHK